MADHEIIVEQLTEMTKLITLLATDQQKLLSEQTKISKEQSKMASEQTKISKEQSKMASEQTKISKEQSKMASEQTKLSNEQSKMASEQIKISNEQSKMANDQSKLAMAQNQFTERLETVAYRQNTLSACVEDLQIAKFPKSDVKSRTPEVARGLDVPLGSSVDTTRGPSLGMGGGLPLDPAPWVRERDMQSSSSYHFGMIRKGGEPDYRWSLPSPCKETTGLPCPTSLTSHPSVKETRHQFADRVGVTGGDENATIGTRSGVNDFATRIDVNMCGVKDSYVAEGAENDVVWMSDNWGNNKCEVEFRSEGLMSFRDRFGVKSASHSMTEEEYVLQKDDADDVRSQVSDRTNLDEMECLTLDETRCDSTPVDMNHPDLSVGGDQKGLTQNNGPGVSMNENGSKVENPRRLETGYHVTRPHANLEYVVSDKTVGSRNVVWSTMGPPVCVPSLSGRRPQMEGDTYRPPPAFHRRCGRDERGDPIIVGQPPSDFMSFPSMSAVVNSSSRPSALRRSNQSLTNNFRSLQPMVMVEPVDRGAAPRVNRRPVFDHDTYHLPQRYSNDGDARDELLEQQRQRILMLEREMYDLRLGLVSDQTRERERSAVSGPRDIQEKSSRSEPTSFFKSLPARRTSTAATTHTAEARTSEHLFLPTADTKPDLATKKRGDGDDPPRCPPTVKTEAVVEKVSTTTSSAATTPRHSWIKLGTYNGRTAVEAFIRKF